MAHSVDARGILFGFGPVARGTLGRLELVVRDVRNVGVTVDAREFRMHRFGEQPGWKSGGVALLGERSRTGGNGIVTVETFAVGRFRCGRQSQRRSQREEGEHGRKRAAEMDDVRKHRGRVEHE